jgi:small subunit ribosomal protein S8
MVTGVISDPIGDLLIRLKNSAMSGKTSTLVPKSRVRERILSILKDAGMIEGIEEKEIKGKPIFEVTLHPGHHALENLSRVSSPGRRLYVKAREIPRPLSGRGLVVISTPFGIMTGKEASKKGVGGEILIAETL